MDEVAVTECVPDLKDLEVKVGRKTPEGLLKWMRQEAGLQGHPKPSCPESGQSEKKGLDEKIRRLKVEMAHLRAVDVRILQQLLALHEGIEAVKWLLEERGPLTSHCSSLTSSQYSLGEGPDTSWRGSWSSLQDPHDKLDNISIGSYLDTLADDLDEYCPSSGADSVVCPAQLGTETSQAKNQKVKLDVPKENPQVGQAKTAPEAGRPSSVVNRDSNNPEANRSDNGVLDSALKRAAEMDSPKARLAEKLGKNLSPKGKTYKNGKVEPEGCKMNGKVHLEYDAHWRWVQSQDDVTFL